ncbi:MAG: tRNA (adenosine(37)-N6)-threonylcarbamoyltransferase complex dimerization subunit type 1 TsaB [Planctomycetota bacterium]|jgi:tRNA threonylcarbamoyladenosine biosynthesis protein TsaB
MASDPLILAVETSGRRGSVALAAGAQILGETSFSNPMKHSKEVFPAASGLLAKIQRKPDEIEQIYISVGPGSFTGLRIAVTMAKILNLAATTKIVAVDTLDVIAANASDYIKENEIQIEKVAAVLDAKRGQFFVAGYQNEGGRWEKILSDCLMKAPEFLEKFAATNKPLRLLGEGLVYYKDNFKADGIQLLPEKYWYPHARKVHLLGWEKALSGEFSEALGLQPAYLRGCLD